MNLRIRRPLLTLALLALPSLATAQRVAFVGASVWDGTGAAASVATILVEDGRIRSVGPGAAPAGWDVVDLSGRWVIPGLIDTHAHVSGLWAADGVTAPADRIRGDLLLFARYGVTLVNSLGDGPDVIAVRHAVGDRPPHARLQAAGPVLADTAPEAARTAAERTADERVDWLKVRVDDNLGTTPKMPWSAVEAVVSVSDRRGIPLATHLFYLDDAKRLLRMGTDLVAHSIRDTDVDEEVIGLLRDTGVCYVATLVREVSTFVYADRPAFLDDPFFRRWANTDQVAQVSESGYMDRMRRSEAAAAYRVALVQAQKNVATLSRAGIPIAFGTDAGPAARFPGYFEHMELALMVEAGLTPEQALRSATSTAADCLLRDDVGTLEPGRWADLLVLRADPLADIAATKSLERVYVGGVEIR